MRGIKWVGAVAVAGAFLVFGSSIPAWADTATDLPWLSPNKVTSGVPVHVASIEPCPALTDGDQVLVQVFLSLGPSGGSGQILSPNANGSWAGDVTFSFTGVGIRQTNISAECLDFTGFSATPYAQYVTRHTQVFD